MYLHVSCMYHVGMCRNVMLCTLTFAMTVSLGCIHDDVRADNVHSAQHCSGQIGTKRMYLPSPEPVVYVVPLSHILGKLPLIPAGDHGTIPLSMHGRKDACYKLGVCDRQGEQGSGSPLFYINTWAMVWPNDYPALAT